MTSKLNRRVTLQERSAVIRNGVSVESYTNVKEMYANVKFSSTKSFHEADTDYYVSTCVVTIRKPATFRIIEGMRVLVGGEAFDILEVIPSAKRNDLLELRASKTHEEKEGSQ